MTEPTELHPEDEAPSPALAAMIDEVRAERPDVDWEKIEARLFDEKGEVRADPPAPRRRWAIVGAFAVAAAFAIAVFSPTRAVDESKPVAVQHVERSPILMGGTPVAVGTVIEGGVGGTWLRSIGRISIRFEPGSRGRLVDDGERIRLALESGAIAADVTPVPGGEPFAVDVAGKRVAVHGTHLRVAMIDGHVEVAVSEGSAVIGAPAGEGRTEGPLVEAGSIGTFGEFPTVVRDPARASSIVEGALAMAKAPEHDVALHAPKPAIPSLPPTVISPPVVQPTGTQPAPSTTAEPNAGPPTVAQTGLSADQLAGPFAQIDADMKKCRLQPGKASFSADLPIEISPEGKISIPSWQPIPPEHRDCVRSVLAKATFPTAAVSTTATKKIDLSP